MIGKSLHLTERRALPILTNVNKHRLRLQGTLTSLAPGTVPAGPIRCEDIPGCCVCCSSSSPSLTTTTAWLSISGIRALRFQSKVKESQINISKTVFHPASMRFMAPAVYHLASLEQQRGFRISMS